MKGTEYTTEKAILRRAQGAIGIPLREIDKKNRLKTGKGAVGSVIEESWFGYPPNSESEPDFPEAGVELKVTPYIKSKGKIRAKERLVCNQINYMTEHRKTFETSDFWHKCACFLLMFYEHQPDIPKGDYTIDKAILFRFSKEDLTIIRQDWEKIMGKIRNGQAHLISEGDTLYLAACPKGANAQDKHEQPFSPILAMKRAYSLKSSYMTHLLNTYIFGQASDEHIIKDPNLLHDTTFEEYIIQTVTPYLGMTQATLTAKFHIESTAKNLNELILAKMLGITGKIASTDEFQKACIVPKTIRVLKNGRIEQSMSFHTFNLIELCQETWEDSTLRNDLEPTKFLFVIFQENNSGEWVFQRLKFWNMPAEDLEEVHRVWDRTVAIIRQGVKLTPASTGIQNNLPKSSESPVAHVRPHAKNGKDTLPLPDGRKMTKQCFWLKNSYIEQQINW